MKEKKRLSLKNGYCTISEFEHDMSIPSSDNAIGPAISSTQKQLNELYNSLQSTSETNVLSPIFGQYPRMLPTKRKIIYEAKRKIERLEHCQRMRNFPYNSRWDEEHTLYKDYLEHCGMKLKKVRC